MSPFSSVREIAVVGFHDRAQVINSPFSVPNRSEDRSKSGYSLQIPSRHRIRHAARGSSGMVRLEAEEFGG